jgi:hypothetical protein
MVLYKNFMAQQRSYKWYKIQLYFFYYTGWFKTNAPTISSCTEYREKNIKKLEKNFSPASIKSYSVLNLENLNQKCWKKFFLFQLGTLDGVFVQLQ